MSALTISSFAAASILYALISLLFIMGWTGQRVGGLLIAACITASAWAGVISLSNTTMPVDSFTVAVFEILRIGIFVALLGLLSIARDAPASIRNATQVAWLLCLTALALAWFLGWDGPGRPATLGLAVLGGIAIVAAGGALSARAGSARAAFFAQHTRLLVLGVAGVLLFDVLFLFLAARPSALDDLLWQARAALNVLFIPILAIAIRRNEAWGIDIFLSRQAILYSSILFAVCLYLLVVGLGGNVVVHYNKGWSEWLYLLLFPGALLLMLALLVSNPLRARFQVFLAKHFFRNKYEYREEWLRLISTLSGIGRGSTKEVVIKALAQIVKSPAGSLWTLDESAKEYRFAASYGEQVELPNFSVDDPLLGFINKHHWLVDFVEFADNPDLYENIALPQWLINDPTAWLIVPLVFRHEVRGLVLLRKAEGSLALNYEDRDLLKTVGHHVAVHLAQERVDNLLTEARQFEAYNRLTAFLMHDLNNLIAQQSLIVENAKKHKRNPDFIDDAMQTIAGSVERMKSVMSELKRRGGESVRKSTQLKFLISTAADNCAGRQPEAEVDIRLSGKNVAVDAERFVMVLTHLIRNAQDATPASGFVKVQAGSDSGESWIRVIDSGSGMSREFIRDRLFKPFDSTKGSQGMGIGAYQAREFVREMGGDLRVESEPGKGTTFTMILPDPPAPDRGG